MNGVINFRPLEETAEDRAFLLRLFATTSAGELVKDWPADEAQKFLQLQFDLQDADYRRNYPAASFLIVLVDGQNAGRFYLDCNAKHLHLIEVTILPEFRGRGIWGRIMRTRLAEADRLGLRVTCQVDLGNSIHRFYRALGFEEQLGEGFYRVMERLPVPSASCHQKRR